MIDNYQRLWRRAWCFYMWDAINGPMNYKPSDSERIDEYESRLVARDHVLTMHPDFVETCQNAWPDIDPSHIRRGFLSGAINSDSVGVVWRSCGGD